jgi:hypothetical protein
MCLTLTTLSIDFVKLLHQLNRKPCCKFGTSFFTYRIFSELYMYFILNVQEVSLLLCFPPPPFRCSFIDCLCGLVFRVLGYRFRGPGFDSRHYQIFWEVVGLKWAPLSLLSTIEELLGRNSSGSGLENQEYGCGGLLRWPHDTLYPQKLALRWHAVVAQSV